MFSVVVHGLYSTGGNRLFFGHGVVLDWHVIEKENDWFLVAPKV